MLGLAATNAIPRLRTIRGAARDIKNNRSELGIGEEPYIQHFTQIRFDRSERRRKADSSALAQIGLLISGSQGIPTVKRIRKTA